MSSSLSFHTNRLMNYEICFQLLIFSSNYKYICSTGLEKHTVLFCRLIMPSCFICSLPCVFACMHACSHMPQCGRLCLFTAFIKHAYVFVCTHFRFVCTALAPGCVMCMLRCAWVHSYIQLFRCVNAFVCARAKSGTRCVGSLNRWPFQHTRLSARALASPKTHKHNTHTHSCTEIRSQPSCMQTVARPIA